MRWYRIRRFDCPRCSQSLAVHAAQVERNERVTCSDCNLDMLLRGTKETGAVGGRVDPDAVVVRLKI